MSGKAPKLTTNEVLSKLTNMTVNLLLSRSDLVRGNNILDRPERDLNVECGYIVGEPSISQYQELYDRTGIATRVVQVYPDESWSVYPELYETEDERITSFERRWTSFAEQTNVWHYLHRVDELSGIGRFGVLLIGLDDGRNLNEPVEGIDRYGRKDPKFVKERNVLYLLPFSEDLVTVKEIDNDKRSPRYGQAVLYSIKMSDPDDQVEVNDDENQTITGYDEDVHWTRIQHVADNRKSSNVFGIPRLRPVINNIFDCRKVLGSASEMFWAGGFPGLSIETLPELAASAELDADSAKAEIEAYFNGLQRYLRLVGMSAKSLAPQVADPTNHMVQLYQVICATIGTPLRIFLGSESGHLASTQDSVAWNRRLKKRQDYYLSPMVIKPFLHRLMLLNVLPTIPKYFIEWRDLNVLSAADRAKISLQRAQAVLQYVTSGSKLLIPPKAFLTAFLDFSRDEADAFLKENGGEEEVKKLLEKLIQATAGNTPNTSGTNPQRSTGAGGRRNGLGKNRKKKNN